MAKKPVKNAAAKKVVAKKAPAKKAPAKKVAAKKAAPKKVQTAVKAAPISDKKLVMETTPVVAEKACGCCCKHGAFCTFIRKLLAFVIIFALGYSAATYCPYGKRFFRNNGPRMQEVFVDGCLDTTKFPNPEMAEAIKSADTDKDGCITVAEFEAGRDAARDAARADRPGADMNRGQRAPMRR